MEMTIIEQELAALAAEEREIRRVLLALAGRRPGLALTELCDGTVDGLVAALQGRTQAPRGEVSEEIVEAQRLIESGVSLRSVSQQLGIPYSTLRRRLASADSSEGPGLHDVAVLVCQELGSDVSPDVIAQALQLAGQGVSWRRIADQLGIGSHNTVGRWVRAAEDLRAESVAEPAGAA
ncbi:hypothetical protein A5785_02445 [Gordonia sp. 852002-50395_SCH5434458]|nr:hypothetical protein A5785_02445 [Gordonia sp. 852002-50395_SCH5434458]